MHRLFYLMVAFMIACKSNNVKSIIQGENIVEGNITRDTIFNGPIKFYNKHTNKLVAEGVYVNGQKNGEYKQFYENGGINEVLYYKNDKENGVAKIYDEKGHIISEEFYYYGLRMGDAIEYKNESLKSFAFFSLDNSRLLYFEYDSLKGKHLPDLVKGFFFFTTADYFERNGDILLKKTEYFLYTPNPPMQGFNYSLVRVDKSFKISSTLISFDKNQPWSKFILKSSFDSTNSKVAIRLLIADSINNIDVSIFKVLK
jgi:antitoxin component YwqK of YwqJK toxin-antitoxin module